MAWGLNMPNDTGIRYVSKSQLRTCTETLEGLKVIKGSNRRSFIAAILAAPLATLGIFAGNHYL